MFTINPVANSTAHITAAPVKHRTNNGTSPQFFLKKYTTVKQIPPAIPIDQCVWPRQNNSIRPYKNPPAKNIVISSIIFFKNNHPFKVFALKR